MLFTATWIDFLFMINLKLFFQEFPLSLQQCHLVCNQEATEVNQLAGFLIWWFDMGIRWTCPVCDSRKLLLHRLPIIFTNHCVKYSTIRVFVNPHYLHALILLYQDRIIDSVLLRESRVSRNPYFCKFYAAIAN